ncbi:sensor histidine kinase [Streptomyces sp. NPDC001941]|uniref:sensor histidine kinase n=1 Tax=Streptomyces sp. NPDC001941 TaxID=3154659 RepID=UPI003323D6E6
MPATTRHHLAERVPPGLWSGAAWCAAALFPLVWPQSAARDGAAPPPGALDTLWGQSFLALSAVLALTGCALLERAARTGFGLLLAGTAAFALAWRQGEVPAPQFAAVDIALGVVAASRPRRASLPFAAAALALPAVFLVVRLVTTGEAGTPSEPFVALTVVVAWLVGNSVHQSRDYAERLRAQLAEQITARAVTAERLRIARELHDMVAHSMGIVALQAGAAARVVATRPEDARTAMLAVESAGRETLSGLRRMLVALRAADDEGDDAGGAPLAPVAGLDHVERLAGATTAAGVRVRVAWKGERRPLPPEIDLSAFRIVQESVTNVVRHAAVDSCDVTLEFTERDLSVEVLDRGRGDGSSAGTGYGLAGMRERVALLHGEFSAGPRPDGGFRVAARLPVPSPS